MVKWFGGKWWVGGLAPLGVWWIGGSGTCGFSTLVVGGLSGSVA